MKCFQLTSGTIIYYEDGILIVINIEIGSSAKGNRYAYQILKLMETPQSLDQVVEKICLNHPHLQLDKVSMAVENIIAWATEHGFCMEVHTHIRRDSKPEHTHYAALLPNN